MADPAKLPEQQAPADARFSRNPVWVLLKGLEGFDTERASECLTRLLSNHYDTISVLKLATKRDLVDDAGILPGDALRIVAAVREYNAPRDPSPEPTPQCGHTGKPEQGVQHSQDVYRPPTLRETKFTFTPQWASPSSSQAQSHSPAVKQQQQKQVQALKQGVASLQEAVKEWKVMDQVEPKQEAVMRDPTLPLLRRPFENGRTAYAPADARFAPADPTLAPPWRALLDGKTGCIYYWNPVMNITQYNKPLPPVGCGPSSLSAPLPAGPPSSVTSTPGSAATHQTIPPGISYPHICRLCNAICSTEDHVRTHYSGQRHNAAFQKAKQSAKPPIAVNPLVNETKGVAQRPVLRDVKLPTQPGKATSELMQPLPSTPIAASLHACGVCNVQCHSEIVLRSHFSGSKHAKKMKIAVSEDDNRPTQHLYCSICDVTCPCKRALVMHFNGKRHTGNMKEDSDSGNSSYYSDTESSDY